MESTAPSIEVSSKLAYLKPGMYLVRLVDGGPGNVLLLSATPVGRGALDFFPGDGVLRNTLSKVGDCIVVRVNGALGSLLLTEFHKIGNQQRITVKIDQVTKENLQSVMASQGTRSVEDAFKTERASLQDSIQEPEVSLLGHVEQRGDIVSQDGWLGDPSSELRIEGFGVSLNGFTDRVKLSYSVLPAHARQYTKPVSGGFVGSRQKAKAIKGVFFKLLGPDAKKYHLSGQAVFLGQAPLAIKSGVALSAKAGKGPLVALHLSIALKESLASSSVSASAWENPAITSIRRRALKSSPSKLSDNKKPVSNKPSAPAKKAVVKKAVVKKAVVKNVSARKVVIKKTAAKKGSPKKK